MASKESHCVPEELAIEPGPSMKARYPTVGDIEAASTAITLSGRRKPEAVLSQAPRDMSHRARLAWLQRRRCTGLWVACDSCNKYRYLQHVHDPLQLPDKWYCNMNPDERYSNCQTPEVALSVAEEEDQVHGTYAAGSVVWAQLRGFPRWPALVDDDPDTEQYYWLDGFSDIPTYYHVVFFDGAEQQIQRAWISTQSLQKYESSGKMIASNDGRFGRRLAAARRQADEALALPVLERLRKYSFLARYSGPINPPRKFSASELRRHGDFTDESSEDEDCALLSEQETASEPLSTSVNALKLSTPAWNTLFQSCVAVRTSATSEWFQLAGHPGSLLPAGPGTVWKRRSADYNNTADNPERDMYELLSACPHMRAVVPVYFGERESNGERFIELQDLLDGFRDPHVMDIKMGTRTFLEEEVCNPHARSDLYDKMVRLDPEAPTLAEHTMRAVTKLRYMQFRERQSSSAELGFRIEALRLPGAPPSAGVDLQRLNTLEQVSMALANFIGPRERTRALLGARLRRIRDLLQQSDFFCHHEIIGSSIFIIFDNERVGAWLIDFAKTRRVPDGMTLTHRAQWRFGNHEEGFLFGLDNLICAVEEMRLPPANIPAAAPR